VQQRGAQRVGGLAAPRGLVEVAALRSLLLCPLVQWLLLKEPTMVTLVLVPVAQDRAPVWMLLPDQVREGVFSSVHLVAQVLSVSGPGPMASAAQDWTLPSLLPPNRVLEGGLWSVHQVLLSEPATARVALALRPLVYQPMGLHQPRHTPLLHLRRRCGVRPSSRRLSTLSFLTTAHPRSLLRCWSCVAGGQGWYRLPVLCRHGG
jgi:hypothetical protein